MRADPQRGFSHAPCLPPSDHATQQTTLLVPGRPCFYIKKLLRGPQQEEASCGPK